MYTTQLSSYVPQCTWQCSLGKKFTVHSNGIQFNSGKINQFPSVIAMMEFSFVTFIYQQLLVFTFIVIEYYRNSWLPHNVNWSIFLPLNCNCCNGKMCACVHTDCVCDFENVRPKLSSNIRLWVLYKTKNAMVRLQTRPPSETLLGTCDFVISSVDWSGQIGLSLDEICQVKSFSSL